MNALAAVTLACWTLLELGLRIREAVQGKGRRERDRSSRLLIAISLGLSVGVTAATGSKAPPALQAIGVAVMWAGLAVRVWAIATLGAAFLRAGLVDEVVAYVAPKLLGAGVNAVGGLDVDSIGESIDLALLDVTRLGDDVRLTLQPRRPVEPVETKETP